jgi:hypothetical protein
VTRRHPAALVPVALVAMGVLLAACSNGSSTSTGKPTSPSSPTTSTGEPSASEPRSLRDFEGSIVPGSNRVPLISWGRTYRVDALIDVPDGFITPGGWVVENGQSGTQYGDLMFWGDVDRVDTNPCGAGRLVKPGPTVRDLAEALTGQVPRRTTIPKPVTVGGYRGLYVETTPPRDLSRCDGGQFTMWKVNDADRVSYSADQPGTVFHLWILDVDGQRVVVAVKVVPGHTTHAAEFVHMAETTEFVENVDE